MTGSIVRKAVMPFGMMFALTAITSVIIAMQFVVHEAIQESTVVAAGQVCPVRSVENSKEGGFLGFGSSGPVVKFNCNGKEYSAEDTKLAVGYLQKPQPLVCTLYKTDKVKCHLQGSS